MENELTITRTAPVEVFCTCSLSKTCTVQVPIAHRRLEDTTAFFCLHSTCRVGAFAALIQLDNIHRIKNGNEPIKTEEEIWENARRIGLKAPEVKTDVVAQTLLEIGTCLQILRIGDETRYILPFGTKYKSGGFYVRGYGKYQRYVDELGNIYTLLPDGTLGPTGQNCFEYFI